MPQFEGTVDEFKEEAENFSDDELEGFAEEDDRAGVQEAARAALAARASGDGDDGDDGEAEDAEPEQEDVGQAEVQAKFDEMEISGVVPPTGGPPSPAHTVQGVTNTLDEEAGTREKAEADFETLHGRAPGDPVT